MFEFRAEETLDYCMDEGHYFPEEYNQIAFTFTLFRKKNE